MSETTGVGLRVHAARPQRELHTAAAHAWDRVDGSPWMERHDTAAGSLLRLPGLADFAISADGMSVQAWPTPGMDEDTCRQLHLNNVLPMALSRQGKLVLHASAVAANGEALVFVGVSGRGKSTLATWLARQGHPLIADDGLVVKPEDGTGRFLAMPGDRGIRLRSDSERELLPDAPAEPLGYTDKRRIHADGTLPTSNRPHPIRAVYLLGDDPGTPLQVRPLQPATAMMELIHYSFLLDVGDPGRHARQMRTAAALASAVTVAALDYPRDYAMLPQVQQAVCSA